MNKYVAINVGIPKCEVFEDTYHLIACEQRASFYRWYAFVKTDVNQFLIFR